MYEDTSALLTPALCKPLRACLILKTTDAKILAMKWFN